MARGREHRRSDGRRLGSGKSGTRIDRFAAGTRLRRARRGRNQRRRRAFQPAGRAEPHGATPYNRAGMSPSLQLTDALVTGCAQALRRAANFLLGRQHRDGYWPYDLTADSTLESDFILLELWRHPPVEGVWNPPSRDRIRKAVRSILARQLVDGGFNIYAAGPSEIGASVKAYTALKLAGLSYDDPDLARLRERILAMGGLQAANSYVKVNLSLFNLYPREHTPHILPEFMLLGNFIYEMSSWTRAIVIPLSIVHAMNPRRPVPAGFTLSELFVPGVPLEFPNDEGFFSWRNFFLKA